MVCFSESRSDHLNPIGYECFKEKLGYFLVVKIQATEMNVNTEHCCSLALSACHAAARRCRFVPEHAVPLITKSHFSFGEFTDWGSSPLCLLSLESGTSADGRGSPCCCLKDEGNGEGASTPVPPLFCFITETIIAWSCLGWQASWRVWGQPNRPEPSQPGPEGIVKADA